MVTTAVIPVAGLGTRFLPQTKALPKELLPVVDKPVVQYIVEEAVAAGLTNIIFVLSPDKEAIRGHFFQNEKLEEELRSKGKHTELATIESLHTMATFQFAVQAEPRGLGDAILQARELVGNEPFVVFGGDDIVESEVPAAKQLIDVYEQYHAPVVGVTRVPEADVVRYGIIDPAETLANDVYKLKTILEKPSVEQAPSTLAVGGRWLLTPDVLRYLDATEPDASGEIQITKALQALALEQPLYAKAYEGMYRDCGNKIEYLKTVIDFALKHPGTKTEIASYIRKLDI
jgi:UTP--glucose-1-phosphate uridylyltransferase